MARPRTKINEDNFGRKRSKGVNKLLAENQAKLKQMQQKQAQEQAYADDALNYVNQLTNEKETKQKELRELMNSATPSWNNREAIDAKMKEIISVNKNLRTARDYYSLYEDVPELQVVEEEKVEAKEEKAESKEEALYTLEDEEALMKQEANQKNNSNSISFEDVEIEDTKDNDFTEEDMQILRDYKYGLLFYKYEQGTITPDEYKEFIDLQEKLNSDLNPNYKAEESIKQEQEEAIVVDGKIAKQQEAVVKEEIVDQSVALGGKKDNRLEIPPISQEELDGLLGRKEESQELDSNQVVEQEEFNSSDNLYDDLPTLPDEEQQPPEYIPEQEGVETIEETTELKEEAVAELEEETPEDGYSFFNVDDPLRMADSVEPEVQEPEQAQEEQVQEEQNTEEVEEEKSSGFFGKIKNVAKGIGSGFATVGGGIAKGIGTVGVAGVGTVKAVGRESLNVLGKDRGERIRNTIILGALAYTVYKQYQNGNALNMLNENMQAGFNGVNGNINSLRGTVKGGMRKAISQSLRNGEAISELKGTVTSGFDTVAKQQAAIKDQVSSVTNRVVKNSQALGRIEPKVDDAYGYVQGLKELELRFNEFRNKLNEQTINSK